MALRLLVLLLILSPPLMAADAAPDTDTEGSQPAPAGNGDSGEVPAEEDDPLLREAAEAAREPPPRPASDDTFTPSVQVSEDLSVSFPVDI